MQLDCGGAMSGVTRRLLDFGSGFSQNRAQLIRRQSDIMAARPQRSAAHVEIFGRGLSSIPWVAHRSVPSHTWSPPFAKRIVALTADASAAGGSPLGRRDRRPNGLGSSLEEHLSTETGRVTSLLRTREVLS